MLTLGIILGAAFGAVGAAIGCSSVIERRDREIERLELVVRTQDETIRLLAEDDKP